MKKTFISVAVLVTGLFISGCGSGNDEGNKETASDKTCELNGQTVDCEFHTSVTSMRKDINSLPLFHSDSASLKELKEKYGKFLEDYTETVQIIRETESLKSLLPLADEFEKIKAGTDSIHARLEVLKGIEVSTLKNNNVVTLSDGMQKHASLSVVNKSDKVFHTLTVRMGFLDRSKKELASHILVVNTNYFAPAAFGAVFPRYYKGENTRVAVNHLLDEQKMKGWDSTSVELLNVTW
jgi:hypothetical protein